MVIPNKRLQLAAPPANQFIANPVHQLASSSSSSSSAAAILDRVTSLPSMSHALHVNQKTAQMTDDRYNELQQHSTKLISQLGKGDYCIWCAFTHQKIHPGHATWKCQGFQRLRSNKLGKNAGQSVTYVAWKASFKEMAWDEGGELFCYMCFYRHHVGDYWPCVHGDLVGAIAFLTMTEPTLRRAFAQVHGIKNWEDDNVFARWLATPTRGEMRHLAVKMYLVPWWQR